MKRFTFILEEVLLDIVAAIIGVIMVLVALDAGLRHFFNMPLYGVVEVVSKYLMVAAVFLALPASVAAGMQIRIDALSGTLPEALRRVLERLFSLVAMMLFGLIAWNAGRTAWDSFQAGEIIAGRINWIVWPSTALIALGALALCLRLAVEARDPDLNKLDGHGAAPQPEGEP